MATTPPRQVAHQESSSPKVSSFDRGTQHNGDHCLLRGEDWSRWISVATHHSTSSKQLFQIGSFFGSFRVPNFRGYFEALNDVFWASFGRTTITLLFCQCTPRWDLSNGPSNDPNEDRIQKLCPREVGLPIYHFGVNKTIGISSSRVLFRVFLLPCFMLKGRSTSL